MKRWMFFIALAAIAAAAVLGPRRKPDAAEMSFEQLLEFLPKEAAAIAKDHHGITLDCSPESMEHVEMILGKLHDEYKRRGTTEGQRGLALAFGLTLCSPCQSAVSSVTKNHRSECGGSPKISVLPATRRCLRNKPMLRERETLLGQGDRGGGGPAARAAEVNAGPA